MIVGGELLDGEGLPAERDLAARFAVSRNVIREALGVLAQKGLVRVEQGRGAFVTTPTSESVRDSLQLLLSLNKVRLLELCDARFLIEPELSRRAAVNSALGTTRLKVALDQLINTEDEPDAHVEADIAFHREIALLADQPILGAIVEAIGTPMRESMALGTTVPFGIKHSDDQHRAIYDAIAAGDEAAAARATRDHIDYVRAYLEAPPLNAAVSTGLSGRSTSV
jgi:GntR family transcriptional repressor for pyruvate dehydrogenase complex